jgi:predicted DNA-binding transcriptional regulator YafY
MRRTDRLFEIIQIVRDGRLHLARDIAEKLEISIRSVYRDIETLVASGFPIEGERGVGYLLREPIFLPPLNLSNLELEALHFGMAVVTNAADAELQNAARSLLAKVSQVVLPDDNRQTNWGFGVFRFEQAAAGFRHMATIRAAVRGRHKLILTYEDPSSKQTTRTVRPLQMEFWGRVWTCTCWCELKSDFRVFRVDRIQRCDVLEHSFAPEAGKNLDDFLDMSCRDKHN